MNEKTKLINPTTAYFHGDFAKQPQEAPGLQNLMEPRPDCGEKSYIGHGRLAGRKMLVTGGDSGIGRAAAIAYAREGAEVAVNYLAFEQSDAEELQNLLESEGHKIFLIPGDISDEASCRRIVKAAADALGGLDNLTMVAGRQQYNRDIMTLSSEQMVKTFATNVFSLFWLTQAALPFLPEGGTIVTTSSVQAYYPGEILIDYASTKCAIIGFTRALAKQDRKSVV